MPFSHICVRLFKSSCDFCQSINLSPQKNAAAAATDWATRRRNIFHSRRSNEPSCYAHIHNIHLLRLYCIDQGLIECFVFLSVFLWVKPMPRTVVHRALGGKFFILSSPFQYPSSSPSSSLPSSSEPARGAMSASAPTVPIFLCLGDVGAAAAALDQ